MLNLRPATPEDVSTILHFIRSLAEYERLLHEVKADETTLRESLFGSNPRAFAVMAEWEGKAAGFALYFYNFSTFLGVPGIFVEDIYVEPEHRGKGIGKALLACLARQAVEEGCGRLDWSVLDWNTPSIEFYRSLGAYPLEEWTGYRLTGESMKHLAEWQAQEQWKHAG